ncbi:MAG: tRNA (N6-isopentenyl adenosine(37)-C2)-methylthiotransferase MiaB [Planctomycetaceae bacterium]|jgi:tRNA-2-methylthio-N6-dimethylallyladenosine synthase|nr:tRNA (N6-isopentenyl adenosine(37)-C2)-methylthiotransferase MiaB [Planctomycetaceae bacterium]
MPKFYIETVGCQMNVLDSEQAVAGLRRCGFERTTDKKDADIILFNTCSVRQHAEDKVYSALGRLKHWKELHPNGIIGVLGCMAQKDQKLIFQRAPFVDLVLGPGQLDKLPGIICDFLQTNTAGCRLPAANLLQVSLTRLEHRHSDVADSFQQYDPLRDAGSRKNKFQAMVRIMFGCDKFCTYCIVPKVRGPEQSRPPKEILDEVKILADEGVLEITLLGQTVNSYKYLNGGTCSVKLADLLYQISEVNGIRRIRFVTNYPIGIDDDLLFAVRDLPKVAPYLHVPAQSGSDSVLKRMKRQYTVPQYKELVEKIYATVPDAAITSDFIVGFCGETDEEFQATVDLVKFARFKNSFIFKYSERPGTKAAELYADNVPEEIKKERNNELLRIQDEIGLELNKTFISKEVEILVDGKTGKGGTSSAANVQLSGRTACDRIVVFDSPDDSLIGQFIKRRIADAAPFTLFG